MSDADARIAALEAQVARLTAALEQPSRGPVPATSDEPAAYDRRTLLRRGGLAVAAGVAAIPMLARPAAAASGDPLVLGKADNTADANPTGLTAAIPGAATLSLANTATSTDASDNTVTLAHPSLRLVPSAAEFGPDARTADAGDLASSGEMLWYTHLSAETNNGSAIFGMVHTSAYANYLEFIRPYRVLDTRRTSPAADNAGRSKIINTPSTAFDAAGKLRGGQTLTVDLSDLVVAGAGVVGNITVAAPEAAGFFTVFPGGQQRPGTSNINYVRGQALANMVVVGLGGNGENTDTIQIFTNQTAHVIFDVFALSVYELGAVDPSFQAPAIVSPRGRLTRG